MNKNDGICIENGIIYLNHAAISPWPEITRRAVERFSIENSRIGSKNYLEWIKIEEKLRENLAQLINSPTTSDIALVKNTSEGLSMVAYGYPWKNGDNVIIPAAEFPSNRIVWQSLKNKGVETRKVDLYPAESPEDRLLSACDDKTQIISVSSVNYANGLKLDLEKIGSFCRENRILFCIDAIQSIGACELDAVKVNADFIIADGHKWMLGPEGLALFYSTPEARDQLDIFEYGWHMTENPHDFTSQEFEVAKCARRFECGSPNMLCTHALKASTDYILKTGMHSIENKVIENTRYLHKLIDQSRNLSCISSKSANRFAGISTFTHQSIDSDRLYQYLMKNNVMCANRMGGIRFSPHFYTSKDHIQQAIELADNAGN